jgi:hypothetical protein
MADQLGDDIGAPAVRQLEHALHAQVGVRQLLDVDQLVGAEGVRELEALADAVDHDDLARPHLFCDCRGVDAQPTRALDDDVLADLEARELQAADNL